MRHVRQTYRGLFALGVVVVVGVLGATAVLLTRDHRTPAAHSAATGVSGPATGAPTHAVSALATFGGDVSFTYPTGWYAGVEEDQDGPFGHSAGDAELLTFLSDHPFEPLCSTYHAKNGGSSTRCKTPPAYDVWVAWTEPTGFSDSAFIDRRYGHPTRIDGRVAWIYQGPAHNACNWRLTTIELALGIPSDPSHPSRAGIAMTACLSGSQVDQHLAEVHRMIASLTVPPAHASKPLSALAICRESYGASAYSAGLVTVGWVRAYPTRAAVPNGGSRGQGFPNAPDSDRAAWCWVTGHRWHWELRTLSVDDPNGPLLAISDATTPPPAPTANATTRPPFPLVLCRQVLKKPVYSARLVTVGWVRAYRPGGPPGAGAPAAHAFPVARSANVAAWCWTGSPGSWTFSAVDDDNEAFTFGSVSGVGLTKPPTGPLSEK
jgi:hypothetical protein